MRKPAEIEGVIFDMDGVLVDSHPVHRNAWRKFLATVGKQVSDDELNFILEGRRREEILFHFLGELPEAIAVEYGRVKEKFFQENFKEIQLIPGVLRFLDCVQSAGLATGLATSASGYRTRETLKRLNLEGKFDAFVTGDDVPAGKPDPTIYRLAAQRMRIAPQKLLALEDAPCGVQAARAAGMRCIGVASNGRADELRRAGAQHVISDFIEVSVERLFELSTPAA